MLNQSSPVLVAAALVCLVASALAGTLRTAENGPDASYVRVKLQNFIFTGKACDPLGNKCDPKFKVDYSWLGLSETYEIPEHSNTNTVYFGAEHNRIFTGPFPEGSVFVVNIEVVDVDSVGPDDQFARFRFEYPVPRVAEDREVVVHDGEASFNIEFRTIFL